MDHRFRVLSRVFWILGLAILSLAEGGVLLLAAAVVAALPSLRYERRESVRSFTNEIAPIFAAVLIVVTLADAIFLSQDLLRGLAHFLIAIQLFKLYQPKTLPRW